MSEDNRTLEEKIYQGLDNQFENEQHNPPSDPYFGDDEDTKTEEALPITMEPESPPMTELPRKDAVKLVKNISKADQQMLAADMLQKHFTEAVGSHEELSLEERLDKLRATREKRRVFLWLIALFGTLMAIGIFMVVGAVVFVSIMTGSLENTGMVSGFFSVAVEMIKLFLGAGAM